VVDVHEDSILVDGVGQLCADLGIDPTDVAMLVLAWHLQAVRMCEFTRPQFVDGLAKLGSVCSTAMAAAPRSLVDGWVDGCVL
jgi:hypothetical protein